MMRRLFWVAAGAAAGILVVHKLSRKARALTPAGMSDNFTRSVQGIRDLAREFVDDVLTAAADRETELLELFDQGPGTTEAERQAWANDADQVFGEIGRGASEPGRGADR